jgi:hypothetical protein
VAFTRDKAVKFAEKHWNIPADDGIFYLSNQGVNIEQVRHHNVIPINDWKKAPAGEGWQPFFVDDGNRGEKAVFQRVRNGKTEEILINPWAGLADCAHFLSRCLTAGGIKIAERGAPGMVSTLQGLSNTKTLCERATREVGQRVIDSGIFKPGDMIGYFNIDPKGDYNGKLQYAHSGMYAGKIGGTTDGGITCHTICRFPGKSWVEDSWWLKPPGHYTYTLIHFSDDDPAPNSGKTDGLVGWWQVDSSGTTAYYLIQRNGTAQSTRRAPAKGAQVIHGPEDAAYWFMALNGEITFIWRKAGNVEVWTADAKGFKSVTNGAATSALKKLP